MSRYPLRWMVGDRCAIVATRQIGRIVALAHGDALVALESGLRVQVAIGGIDIVCLLPAIAS